MPVGVNDGTKLAWDCKATAQCGAKHNFGWRERCRACQRDRLGRPPPAGQVPPARSRWLDGPPQRGQSQVAKLEKEVEDLKKQLAAKAPAGADAGGPQGGGSDAARGEAREQGAKEGPAKEQVDELLAFLNEKLLAA